MLIKNTQTAQLLLRHDQKEEQNKIQWRGEGMKMLRRRQFTDGRGSSLSAHICGGVRKCGEKIGKVEEETEREKEAQLKR